MGFQGLGKQGSIADLVFILVFVFVAALSILIAFLVYEQYTGATEDIEAFNNTYTKSIQAEGRANLLNFDYLFLFIVFGLLIMTIVSGFYVSSHPVFFFISLLLLIIVIIMAAMFANIYDEITDAKAFEEVNVTVNYPITDYFMNNFPTMLLLIGVILMIVFYAKQKLGGYSNE